MRLATATAACILLLMSNPKSVRAQAAVEYGLGAGNAVGVGSAAGGLGKKISGIAGSLDQTVKPQSQTTTVIPATRRKSAARTPPLKVTGPTPVYEDLKGVEVGMTYSTLVKRFGPPAMEIADSTGKTLTYAAKAGVTQIDVRDETVISVRTGSQPGLIAAK